ncbi:hypothetical protein BC834DRAFT_859159 [Gloeopeniophorella convolvens]|nr:hypothetical protein BC834DRAFT_859159 [Gloeopeniophorella convolvens]
MSVVAHKNPFAILGDDSSDAPTTTPASKKADAPAAQPTRTAAKSKGPASRGGRYYPRGGKAPRDSAQDGQDEPAVGDDGAKKRCEYPSSHSSTDPFSYSPTVDGEGRGRGRGRGRGDRGRGRGRPFDRHSQTGKTDSDKKVHQSWGGDEGGDELKAEEGGKTDAQVEGAAAATDDWGAAAAAEDWGATPAEGDAAPAADAEKGAEGRRPREREPEEEDNTISYDQYLAQLKEAAAAAVPKLEGVREANEGDDDVWRDAVQRKKSEEEDAYFVGKTKTSTKARTEKKEKVFIEIDARFDRPNRGGRGRGTIERGRGRGRGAPRGGRTNGSPAAVNVDDETAFPSLS